MNLRRVAGAAGSGESVREPQPLGQGGADSRALSFPKPPGPSLGRHITLRAIDKERWAGWLVPFECGFSFSFPPSAPPLPPPPPPALLSNRSLLMIAWIAEEEIRSLLKERCLTKLMNK